jgi:hypothetical protein
MSGHTVDEQIVIEGAVAKALNDVGVRDDSQLRQVLIHDAMVYDLVEVCVPDADGKSVSLQSRLAQMKQEPRWKGEFHEKPAPPGRPAPTPAGAMLTPDREAFKKIVNGETMVR